MTLAFGKTTKINFDVLAQERSRHETDEAKSSVVYRYRLMLLGKTLNKDACTDPNVEPPYASASESLRAHRQTTESSSFLYLRVEHLVTLFDSLASKPFGNTTVAMGHGMVFLRPTDELQVSGGSGWCRDGSTGCCNLVAQGEPSEMSPC